MKGRDIHFVTVEEQYNENKILVSSRIKVYAFSETSLGKCGPCRGSAKRLTERAAKIEALEDTESPEVENELSARQRPKRTADRRDRCNTPQISVRSLISTWIEPLAKPRQNFQSVDKRTALPRKVPGRKIYLAIRSASFIRWELPTRT